MEKANRSKDDLIAPRDFFATIQLCPAVVPLWRMSIKTHSLSMPTHRQF